MSAQRKPRPIGPQAEIEAAEAAQERQREAAQAEFNLVEFLENLPAGDLMDLDEVANGAFAVLMSGGEQRITLKMLLGIAWIVRRRNEPRLTFSQVRMMTKNELADLLNSLDSVMVPKASSANDS